MDLTLQESLSEMLSQSHLERLLWKKQLTLIEAGLIGAYLNKLKEQTDHGNWSSVLKDKFGGSCRNGQNYMKIARHWDQIEPHLQKESPLSIAGALRILEKETT